MLTAMYVHDLLVRRHGLPHWLDLDPILGAITPINELHANDAWNRIEIVLSNLNIGAPPESQLPWITSAARTQASFDWWLLNAVPLAALEVFTYGALAYLYQTLTSQDNLSNSPVIKELFNEHDIPLPKMATRPGRKRRRPRGGHVPREFKRMVKKVMVEEAERKHIDTFFNTSTDEEQSRFYSSATPVYLTPIVEGTGSDERDGNDVNILGIRVHGTIIPPDPASSASAPDAVQDQYRSHKIRMTIGWVKQSGISGSAFPTLNARPDYNEFRTVMDIPLTVPAAQAVWDGTDWTYFYSGGIDMSELMQKEYIPMHGSGKRITYNDSGGSSIRGDTLYVRFNSEAAANLADNQNWRFQGYITCSFADF